MSSVGGGQREKTIKVHQRLLEEYGEPTWRPPLDAVSELVSTILSQNTNDVNRDVAFDRLRSRLPTWEEVRDAEQATVIEAIRPAGLANQKGPRIQEALRLITRERGELELDFLADWPVEEAKTASDPRLQPSSSCSRWAVPHSRWTRMCTGCPSVWG